MKIKSITISNFGNLHDYHADMDDKLTCIMEGNEWGKSTLSAFIRVMFYGFKNEGAKKDSSFERERLRLFPWQGGVYGGNIVFEANGKEYRLVRTFGNRAGGDRFHLYDNVTNMEVSDFSSDIGRELFQLDAEGFDRTVFFGQNDLEAKVNNMVNARLTKVGNLSDDLGKLQGALKRIDEKKLPLQSPRGGRIPQLNNDILRLENDLRSAAGANEQIAVYGDELEKTRSKLEYAQNMTNALEKELDKASRKAAILINKSALKKLDERVREREALLEKARDEFPAEIPEKKVLLDLKDRCRDIDKRRQDEIRSSLSEAEEAVRQREGKLFAGSVPSKEEIDKYKTIDKRILEKETALRDLEISEKEAAGRRKMLLLTAGCVLLALGAVLVWIKSTIIGAACAVAGAVLIMTGYAGKKDNGDLGKLADEIESMKNELESFLRPFNALFDKDQDYSDKLIILDAAARRYEDITAKYHTHEVCEDDLKAAEEPVAEYLKSLGFECTNRDGLSDKLNMVMGLLDSYLNAKEELSRVRNDRNKYVEENGTVDEAELKELEGVRSVEDINVMRARYREELKALTGRISECSEHYDKALARKDELDCERQEIEEKKEELENALRKYELYEAAGRYLKMAKTSLTARYTDPLARGFKKYYELLEGEAPEKYSFDANAELIIDDMGDRRQLGNYSAGSRDKVSICYRMGLVEAMFTDEKPFLIMDDPFVNLDEGRLERAKEMLHRLSEQYQIIYLTCHQSRMV